jgi:RimJ/RimL family protein N-acetyltransferase
MKDLSQIEELPVLSGDVVMLRPWRDDDAAAVAAMCDDEGTARWLPVMPHPYTLADGEEWVAGAAPKWLEQHWANFAVDDPATGALVGSCGLRIEAEKESGEIGYLVHRDHRRRGIAAACVALLTDWAFDELGLGRLQIRADTRNVPSRRTIAACGYAFEAVLRDAEVVHGERVSDVLHALLPRDPRPWRDPGTASRGFGWPRLTDGRLVVRPYEQEDAPAEQALCDQPEMAHWLHLVPGPYGLTDAEEFIADSRHRLLLGDRARLAITDAASGELLGSVSLDLFAERQAAEIGYLVRRESRRQGVALAAVRLVVDWAFGTLGVERLEVLTYPGNEASQALAIRLGFTREALLRGFLAPEAGKSREGRVVPSADGGLPPRDDQVQFVRLRSDPAPAD